jgi:hypothetical protein
VAARVRLQGAFSIMWLSEGAIRCIISLDGGISLLRRRSQRPCRDRLGPLRRVRPERSREAGDCGLPMQGLLRIPPGSLASHAVSVSASSVLPVPGPGGMEVLPPAMHGPSSSRTAQDGNRCCRRRLARRYPLDHIGIIRELRPDRKRPSARICWAPVGSPPAFPSICGDGT